jgi:peptidoglycan hydrolase CwlO-like protein
MFDHPAFLAAVAALPALVIGYMVHRASLSKTKSDSQYNAVKQVIDGLNAHIANLQNDNKALREEVARVSARCDKLEREIVALKAEVAS